MNILVTGGCGFIGSHQAVDLLDAGHEVTLVDDLSNARAGVVERIGQVAGRTPAFVQLDMRDTTALTDLMVENSFDAVIHFAGLKHVRESMERPIDYLDVNLAGLTSLLQAADDAGTTKLLFSSSGSIYGEATTVPIPEEAAVRPTNPYSRSKAICEQVLSTVCSVDDRWSVVALRYFNPTGAHPSGLLGEDPTHLISNIVPVLMEVASGAMDALTIFGTDFDTPDGTAIRDYVHVMDVARAHTAALDLLEQSTGFEALNIGRGEGVSVREIVAATERVIGRPLPVSEHQRRPGDVAALAADTTRSKQRLGMVDYQTIDTMLADAWRFRVGRES